MTATNSDDDTVKELKKLKQMLEDGLIPKNTYEAKCNQLLKVSATQATAVAGSAAGTGAQVVATEEGASRTAFDKIRPDYSGTHSKPKVGTKVRHFISIMRTTRLHEDLARWVELLDEFFPHWITWLEKNDVPATTSEAPFLEDFRNILGLLAALAYAHEFHYTRPGASALAPFAVAGYAEAFACSEAQLGARRIKDVQHGTGRGVFVALLAMKKNQHQPPPAYQPAAEHLSFLPSTSQYVQPQQQHQQQQDRKRDRAHPQGQGQAQVQSQHGNAQHIKSNNKPLPASHLPKCEYCSAIYGRTMNGHLEATCNIKSFDAEVYRDNGRRTIDNYTTWRPPADWRNPQRRIQRTGEFT